LRPDHPKPLPTLAFDIGNTTVKAAVGAARSWHTVFRASTTPVSSLADRLADGLHDRLPADCERCIACSVHPEANAAVGAFWRGAGRPGDAEFFGADLPVPIATNVDHPERVGTDRLLLALGARALAGPPCVVVSAGTAITVDLVDPDGAFAGGAIAPGFGLAAAALHERTALLPLVEPRPPERLPATDTPEAVEAGVYWCCAGGVAALIKRYALPTVGNVPIVCTGGDAELLRPVLPAGTLFEPQLVFVGMARALSQE